MSKCFLRRYAPTCNRLNVLLILNNAMLLALIMLICPSRRFLRQGTAGLHTGTAVARLPQRNSVAIARLFRVEIKSCRNFSENGVFPIRRNQGLGLGVMVRLDFGESGLNQRKHSAGFLFRENRRHETEVQRLIIAGPHNQETAQ